MSDPTLHPVADGPQGPYAKVILDSISEKGHRLTTLEVRMHRFVLAEFNTHRVFSRNSASSRAIPVVKQINKILMDPALPVHWGAEQKGMQSGDALDELAQKKAIETWGVARDAAVHCANQLLAYGVHKSLINRLLEPFMWHTVIVTSTEWANFFNQRCDAMAQPEMKAAADLIQLAYYNSVPKPMAYGEWHTPYVTQQDDEAINDFLTHRGDNISHLAVTQVRKQVSTARCARVSYENQNGTRDIAIDVDMHDTKLVGPGHWSPFEHVATPVGWDERETCGNFTGWKQYRKQFAGENRTTFIPNLDELAQHRMKGEAGLKV